MTWKCKQVLELARGTETLQDVTHWLPPPWQVIGPAGRTSPPEKAVGLRMVVGVPADSIVSEQASQDRLAAALRGIDWIVPP